MTSPRNTSTETNRGACTRGRGAFVLDVSDGELTAVTISRVPMQISIRHSSFYGNDADDFECLWNVKKLQIKIVELFT
jgi:hypothetical protein